MRFAPRDASSRRADHPFRMSLDSDITRLAGSYDDDDETTPVERPLWALARHPVFEGVDARCVSDVLQAGALKTYAPGDFLVREGDAAEHYFMLASGSVRVFYASPEGLEVTVQLYGAPSAWAEIQLLHDQRHSENCVAVDRARALRVPKRDFLRLMHAHPAFMMNVLRDASARLLLASHHERAVALSDVGERLADLLLSYVRMYGVPAEGGQMIRIPLSQADLARGLGVALKSVSRAFQELIHDGVLEKRGARYLVKNVDALRAQAPGVSHGIDWVAGRRLVG